MVEWQRPADEQSLQEIQERRRRRAEEIERAAKEWMDYIRYGSLRLLSADPGEGRDGVNRDSA